MTKQEKRKFEAMKRLLNTYFGKCSCYTRKTYAEDEIRRVFERKLKRQIVQAVASANYGLFNDYMMGAIVAEIDLLNDLGIDTIYKKSISSHFWSALSILSCKDRRKS